MSKVLLRRVFQPAAVLLSVALLATAASAQAGMTTQSGKASDAFPGLQKFLNLPAAERSQVSIYYNLRIKHCDASQVRAVLVSGGKEIPLRIAGDGRVTPLPTREQLNGGATLNMTMPSTCTIGPKIKVYSTQPAGRTYDAAGLATGIKQGNSAMGKIAGALAMTLKKLDRVYFVGADGGTVEVNGQSKALPETGSNEEYPTGTPYYVPSQYQGATRITLSRPASVAMFDTPPK